MAKKYKITSTQIEGDDWHIVYRSKDGQHCGNVTEVVGEQGRLFVAVPRDSGIRCEFSTLENAADYLVEQRGRYEKARKQREAVDTFGEFEQRIDALLDEVTAFEKAQAGKMNDAQAESLATTRYHLESASGAAVQFYD